MGREPNLVTLTQTCFRPQTAEPQARISFVLCGGGLGDYIMYVRALQWIAENCPHLKVQLFVPTFFFELATYWLSGYGWEIHMHQDIKQRYKKNDPALAPDYPERSQLLNACGAHPLQLGFNYYANMDYVPDGFFSYPELNLPRNLLPRALESGAKKYAVLTPGSTTPIRTLPASAWNELIKHTLSLGLTPVFLGKTVVSGGYGARFSDEVRYSEGLDLRERTTLKEAAAIMQHAEFTLGLDNGLLHLANCTPGSVVFAYNVAEPRHRRTPRPHPEARTEELIITEEELTCIHCQSRMKLMFKHDFANCFYSDLKCLGLLCADNCARWKSAIGRLLISP